MSQDQYSTQDPTTQHVEPDASSTTGTGESGEFVGRVAGQDVGYAEETGAERRAAAQQEE